MLAVVEIVRVDRYGQDNSLQVVLEQDLQDKSDRPYFIASMGLPEGPVYLSKVDLNQENGQIIKPLELVLRTHRIPRHSRLWPTGCVRAGFHPQRLRRSVPEPHHHETIRLPWGPPKSG